MTEQLPLNTSPLPVKLRVEDYLALDDLGAFDSYAKTELIEGEIFFMNAQHRPHARTKTRLLVAMTEALKGSGLEAMVEGSVAMPPINAPEPDIVVTSEAEGEGLVPLASVWLIVEVSDTTLQTDLGAKATIYAREGVPEYWVADVNARVIHQFWTPKDGAYAEQRQFAFGTPVVSATIDGLEVETAGL